MKTVSPVATGSSESLSAQSLSSQVDLARKQPAEPSTPLAPPEEASASASLGTQQIPANQNGEPVILSVKAPTMADPETLAPKTPLVARIETLASKPSAADVWTSMVKGTTKLLQKKGKAFTLPSGEACVKIPNQIIEKNRKAWDCFILGQFYSDPPPQGLVHSVSNGIWSRHHRDITVTKMEGFSFLFRIPNAATRRLKAKPCLLSSGNPV